MNNSDRKMINHVFDLTYKTLNQSESKHMIEQWDNRDFVNRMIELIKMIEEEIINRSMK